MYSSFAFVALGANLPYRNMEPAETIRAALAALGNGIKLERVSRLYSSRAWPDENDPPFVNAVALVSTDLEPDLLLARLQATELTFGRRRSLRNAPRTLDLDILDYDGRIESGPPILPHPRMHTRAFVTLPLGEIAPGWCHPVTGSPIEALVAALPPAERDSIVPI